MKDSGLTLRSVLAMVAGLCVGIVVVGFIWLLVSLHDATDNIDHVTTDIRNTQKSSRTLLDLITSCTDVDGKCYQEQAAQGAEQVGSIRAGDLAGLFCIDQVLPRVYSYDQLATCVDRITQGKTKP